MAYGVWQQFIQTDLGVVIPSATVEVRDENTGSLAVIYSGPAGGALANPFTASVTGLARFYAAEGSYKITATSGTDSGILRHQPVGMAQYEDIGTDDGQVPLAEDVIPRINTEATTSRTLVAADAMTHIRFTSGSATTVVLDVGVFAERDMVRLFRDGSGTVTLDPSSGVTVNAKALALSPRYGCATLVCVGTDEYDYFGDLA